MSAFSGRILELSALMVSPAVENTLSEGVEEAWAHKYFLQKWQSVPLLPPPQNRVRWDGNSRKPSVHSYFQVYTLANVWVSWGATCCMSCSSSPNSSSRAGALQVQSEIKSTINVYFRCVNGLFWIYHMVIIMNSAYMAFLFIFLFLHILIPSLAPRVFWHWYLKYEQTESHAWIQSI